MQNYATPSGEGDRGERRLPTFRVISSDPGDYEGDTSADFDSKRATIEIQAAGADLVIFVTDLNQSGVEDSVFAHSSLLKPKTLAIKYNEGEQKDVEGIAFVAAAVAAIIGVLGTISQIEEAVTFRYTRRELLKSLGIIAGILLVTAVIDGGTYLGIGNMNEQIGDFNVRAIAKKIRQANVNGKILVVLDSSLSGNTSVSELQSALNGNLPANPGFGLGGGTTSFLPRP